MQDLLDRDESAVKWYGLRRMYAKNQVKRTHTMSGMHRMARCKEPCEGKTAIGDKKTEQAFLNQLKPSLVTKTEIRYLDSIKAVLPPGYLVQRQVNLASFILRADDARFQNK